MTIAVDWDIKQKKNKKQLSIISNSFILLFQAEVLGYKPKCKHLMPGAVSPPSSVSESLSNSSSSEYSGSHIYPVYPKLSFSSPEAIITQ